MRLRLANVLGAAALVAVGTLAPLGSGVAQTGNLPEAPVDIEKQVLTTDVNDPTSIAVADDGRVIIGERTGTIKVWHQDGTFNTAGTIEVSACGFDCPSDGSILEEGGLHGLLLSQDFLSSGRIYVYYSVPNSLDPDTGEGIFRLSTFVLTPQDTLELDSEQVILENPAEWAHCCHYGGDLVWLNDGTIAMSVGDDTSPRDEGWNPRDKREGREAFNAERTSQNPLDRRGKILRFNPDGSVPDDNPHADDPAYDPLVYAMGFRSNYRITADPQTGAVYVGNVGPDAQTADESRGPAGYDEVEVVPPGGGTNHGWPRCIADNIPYQDYDYETGESNGLLSCEGFTPAAIYYQAPPSSEFPLMLSGARTAEAGVVYRHSGQGALSLPATYDGKLLMMEWSRDLMHAIPINDDGSLQPAGMTLMTYSVKHPIDAYVGPDGAVYVVEYGEFYYNNTTSQISRFACARCTADPADYEGSPTVETPPAEEPAPAPGAEPEDNQQAAPDDQGPMPSTGAGVAYAGAVVLLATGLHRRKRIV